ncbi:MAG: hypothetical protein AAGD96_00320 [Chloroflexota bacterium]
MSNNIINVIRSGSIGGVSGVKGSAAAGAIGGGTLMLVDGLASVSQQTGLGFVVLSLLMGLTTGMMTGAVIGYAQGWLNGMVSGTGWGEGNLKMGRVNGVWYASMIIVWSITGYLLFNRIPVVGVIGGIAAGILAAYISIKDFVHMIEVQSAEINPDDLRPDKNRWKHPEEIEA